VTLLIPAFALLHAPPVLTVWLLGGAERSPTIPSSPIPKDRLDIHSFGTMLEPRYVVGARALDQ
jgi:hypothetical protein